MPDRNVLALLESDAEQARGAVEGGGDHVVEREVRLDRGVVEIGALEAELFGVEAPVPGRELEIAALGRDQRLHLVTIGERPGAGRLPDPLEQAAHRVRRLGHGILEPVGGEGRVTQQLGALLAQLQDLDDGRVVVVGIAVVAARRESLVDLLAQVAPGRALQERLDRGARQGDDGLAGHAALFCRGLGAATKLSGRP